MKELINFDQTPLKSIVISLSESTKSTLRNALMDLLNTNQYSTQLELSTALETQGFGKISQAKMDSQIILCSVPVLWPLPDAQMSNSAIKVSAEGVPQKSYHFELKKVTSWISKVTSSRISNLVGFLSLRLEVPTFSIIHSFTCASDLNFSSRTQSVDF